MQKYVTLEIESTRLSITEDPKVNKLMADVIHQIRRNLEHPEDFQGKDKFADIRFAKLHSRKDLKKRHGKHYKQTVEKAIALGLIIPRRSASGKVSYCSGNENSKGYCKNPDAFPKMYRVNDNIYAEIKRHDFVKIEITVPNPLLSCKFATKKANPNTKTLTNKKSAPDATKKSNRFGRLEGFLKQLGIRDSVYDEAEYSYFDRNSNMYIEMFGSKKHLISNGNPEKPDEEKSGRIYSAPLLMHRPFRKHLYHESGKKMVIIDVRTSNALLMGKHLEETERNVWLKINFGGNLYTDLVGVDASKKKKYKDAFMAAVTNKPLTGKAVQEIRDALKTRFPSIYPNFLDRIHAANKTVATVLGRLETELLRKPFEEEERFNIPMNDGMIIFEEDIDYFVSTLQEVAKQKLGYPLNLKITELDGETEVVREKPRKADATEPPTGLMAPSEVGRQLAIHLVNLNSSIHKKKAKLINQQDKDHLSRLQVPVLHMKNKLEQYRQAHQAGKISDTQMTDALRMFLQSTKTVMQQLEGKAA